MEDNSLTKNKLMHTSTKGIQNQGARIEVHTGEAYAGVIESVIRIEANHREVVPGCCSNAGEKAEKRNGSDIIVEAPNNIDPKDLEHRNVRLLTGNIQILGNIQ